ncbi:MULTISPECIES: winged helix DNA-binding protein [Sphingomonadaceae]|uniref:winged helix DNA-binding protein n=1 Tax=Sphingomonadales TaxID=204457 RepID=UPI00076FEC68|nr:winged helix DNA-binding protein [Sphingobium sp. TKS]AMK23191.1 hypothetical protein K426_11265 [Sphingobium sp. TKS]MCF8707573.1 winged helix DNA-binding protein [Rhizorhapis sp. SPR117]
MSEESANASGLRDKGKGAGKDLAKNDHSDGQVPDDEQHLSPAPNDPVSHPAYLEGVRIAHLFLSALRLREDIFGEGLFADPAWDILLDLHGAEAREENVNVTSFSPMAPSTSARWAQILSKKGLVVRTRDPKDRRRIHLRLTPQGRALMRTYFDTLIQRGAGLTR